MKEIYAGPLLCGLVLGFCLNASAQITVLKTKVLQSDADTNNKPSPGDTLRYTIVITNTSSSNLLNIQIADTNFPNQTLVAGTIKSSPVARPDSYTAIGNTTLTIDAGAGVLSNDSDPDGDPISVTGASSTSAQGGTVAVAANGSFTYISAAGFNGTDTFNYTIGDGNGGFNTATVTVTVGNRVWYVNNSGANGDGRQTSPFNSLSPVNGVSSVNDFIYLFQGSGNYTAGIVLKNGQQLVGSGDALVVGATTIFGAGTRPTILATTGTGVSLGSDNIVHGLNIRSASGRAISGASAGNLVISNAIASAVGDRAVSLSTGTVNVLLDSASSTNSVDNGISLSAINGSFVANGGFIIGAAGTDFAVLQGNGTVTYAGGINNTVGRSVDISGRSGGAVTLSGNITDTGTGINMLTNSGGTTTFSGTTKTLNTGANTAVTLSSNTGHTINFSNGGLAVNTTTAVAFSVAGGGTVNVTGSGNTITSTTGTTLLNSGTGGSAVIDINAPLTGTGRLIDIQNRTSGNVTLSGNLNNTGGTGMLIQNNSGGGTIALSGTTKTFNTGANTAVSLVNNTGTTINFTPGSLSITTTTGTGFNATGGGTVSVVGTGNIISSGNGSGLNVANTTIGASGLTFQSISSSGGSATGIILNGTGSSGGLTVTGTGGVASGGTLANKTGADGSATQGSGVYLNNCVNVSLTRMQLNGFQNFGIRGLNVTGFTLNGTVINGANGTSSAGGSREGAIGFDGLFGTASIANCIIGGTNVNDGSFSDDLRVENTSGTLTRLTVTNCLFGTIGINGNNGLTFSALNNGTVMNLTLQDSVLVNAIGSLATITFSQNSTMDVVVRRNKFSNNNVNQSSGGGGLVLQGGSGNSTVTYDISCNTFRDAVGIALLVAKGNGSGTMTGSIINNTVGVTGVSLSGSTQASGIKVKATGTGTHTVMIRNNVVRQTNEEGIFVQNNDGSATLNASIFGNTVAEPGSFSFAGLNVDIGAIATDSSICNVVVGSAGTAADKNEFSAGDPFNFSDVNLSRIAGAGTQLNLSKNGSASVTAANVIKDDNLNPATTNTGVSGTVNLVTAPPATPPVVAACSTP